MQLNPILRHSLFWNLRYQAWFKEFYWTAKIGKTERTMHKLRIGLFIAGSLTAVVLFFYELGWVASLIVFLLSMAHLFAEPYTSTKALMNSMQEKERWSTHRHEVDQWWEYGESAEWEDDEDIDQAYAKLSEFSSVTSAREHENADEELLNECMDRVNRQLLPQMKGMDKDA